MMPILYNLVLVAAHSMTVMPSAYYKGECLKYADWVSKTTQENPRSPNVVPLCIPLGEPNQLPAELGKK